jgi:hypothetical protein
MADLNAHEAGNGGQSQRKPKAQSGLLYSANGDAGADPPLSGGRPKSMQQYERTGSSALPGYWQQHACIGDQTQHGKPKR